MGEGSPAVAWHSMFVDSRSWDRVVPDLARHRRLYLIDAPSSGLSDPLRQATDIMGCTRAAVEVLQALDSELDGPVDWIGNAWGGHVGMELAAMHPEYVRSLVAISAPTHPIDRGLRMKVTVLKPLYRIFGSRGLPARAIEETLFTDRTRSTDHEALELLRSSMRRSSKAGMVRAIETAILNRTDLGWAAAAIDCPVLFVTTDDRGEWTPEEAQAVAAMMTDARVITVQDSRVIPAIEQAEALARAVVAFWGCE
ncbi:alpha/beta hydrolase [Williamsia sp.]|uniref:alpha/beta fold hydrolase n=1 Tax=Williamsia sp. TaxID=1872085 RepID=UPI002F9425E0